MSDVLCCKVADLFLLYRKQKGIIWCIMVYITLKDDKVGDLKMVSTKLKRGASPGLDGMSGAGSFAPPQLGLAPLCRLVSITGRGSNKECS